MKCTGLVNPSPGNDEPASLYTLVLGLAPRAVNIPASSRVLRSGRRETARPGQTERTITSVRWASDRIPTTVLPLKTRRNPRFRSSNQTEPVSARMRFLATPLFSLRENAIAKEPGSSYFKPRRCVSRLGLATGGSDSLESSPYVTLSRGAFSASSLVTPLR